VRPLLESICQRRDSDHFKNISKDKGAHSSKGSRTHSFNEIVSVSTSRLGLGGAKTLLYVPGRSTRSRSLGHSLLYCYGFSRYRVSGWLAARCFHDAPQHALPGYFHTARLSSGNAYCVDGSATSPDGEQDRGDHCFAMCCFVYFPGTRSLFNRCQAVCQANGPIRSVVSFAHGLIAHPSLETCHQPKVDRSNCRASHRRE
jgi:hypothetical protein